MCEIEIHYLAYIDPFHPRNASGMTNANGIVKLRVARKTRNYSMLITNISSEKYQYDQINYRPGEFFRADRKKNFVINLYKEPRPKIMLIFPKGFRGAMKVHMTHPTKEPPATQPGQRFFSFCVPVSGRLEIPDTPLLQHPIRWIAKYADGTPIRSLYDSGGLP